MIENDIFKTQEEWEDYLEEEIFALPYAKCRKEIRNRLHGNPLTEMELCCILNSMQREDIIKNYKLIYKNQRAEITIQPYFTPDIWKFILMS